MHPDRVRKLVRLCAQDSDAVPLDSWPLRWTLWGPTDVVFFDFFHDISPLPHPPRDFESDPQDTALLVDETDSWSVHARKILSVAAARGDYAVQEGAVCFSVDVTQAACWALGWCNGPMEALCRKADGHLSIVSFDCTTSIQTEIVQLSSIESPTHVWCLVQTSAVVEVRLRIQSSHIVTSSLLFTQPTAVCRAFCGVFGIKPPTARQCQYAFGEQSFSNSVCAAYQ
mmetsp:Transcript_34157/g.73679  ORF Transcript_34157/g.73679 Transcript_34157/m.73679 type:complete len:227 (+) Transcript_34157:27-707(+)